MRFWSNENDAIEESETFVVKNDSISSLEELPVLL